MGDSFLEDAMTKPYSADLRVRVVEAVDEGATRHEAAERFSVSVSSAVRWHQAWRNEGTIEAKPYGGSRSPLEDYAEELLAVIEEQSDLTLDEIVAVMRKRKIPGSRTALCRFLARHAVTSKKSPLSGSLRMSMVQKISMNMTMLWPLPPNSCRGEAYQR